MRVCVCVCKARLIHSFPHLLGVNSQRGGQFEQGSDAAATTPLFWDESGVKLGNHRNTLSSAHVWATPPSALNTHTLTPSLGGECWEGLMCTCCCCCCFNKTVQLWGAHLQMCRPLHSVKQVLRPHRAEPSRVRATAYKRNKTAFPLPTGGPLLTLLTATPLHSSVFSSHCRSNNSVNEWMNYCIRNPSRRPQSVTANVVCHTLADPDCRRPST